MNTYTFCIRTHFGHEPTRTELSALTKFIARRTTVSAVIKVEYHKPLDAEDYELWTVTITFHCTRVQAARALVPQRFNNNYETSLLLIQDSDGTFLKTPYLLANYVSGVEDGFYFQDWPQYYIPKQAS